MDNFKKSTKCYICDVQTYGIFNPATDLIKKLEKHEENLKARQESEDNEFDSDDLKDIGAVSKDIVNECENNQDNETEDSLNNSYLSD